MKVIKIYFYALTALLEEMIVEYLPNNTITLKNDQYRYHAYALLSNLYDEACKIYELPYQENIEAKISYWANNNGISDMNIFTPLSKNIFIALEENQSAKIDLLKYVFILEALLDLTIIPQRF